MLFNLRVSFPLWMCRAAFVMSLAVSIVSAAQSQAPAKRLSFEAATVRPTNPATMGTGGILIGCHGTDTKYPAGLPLTPPPLGRCILRGVSLKALFGRVYGGALPFYIMNEFISGGPAWASTDRFDVEGKAEDPAGATEAELNRMLKTLLEDRFGLKFHRETRMTGGFALTVDKNGPKGLKPSSREVAVVTGKEFQGFTMSRLVEYLRPKVGRPVSDQTGLRGAYDFTLSPTADDTSGLVASLPPQLAERITAPTALNGSIFTVIKEELGLKLESQQVPVEVFVIDQAERPKEN